ncbi:hypothetical protein ACH4VR_26840 [Streptomyces sp. NPDC020883]|uniref:hypothetical protein n=1 Tax=Streptomyces sp. NPDC020883 TaxID=3365099 RepID=UPI0037B33E8B
MATSEHHSPQVRGADTALAWLAQDEGVSAYSGDRRSILLFSRIGARLPRNRINNLLDWPDGTPYFAFDMTEAEWQAVRASLPVPAWPERRTGRPVGYYCPSR